MSVQSRNDAIWYRIAVSIPCFRTVLSSTLHVVVELAGYDERYVVQGVEPRQVASPPLSDFSAEEPSQSQSDRLHDFSKIVDVSGQRPEAGAKNAVVRARHAPVPDQAREKERVLLGAPIEIL